MGGRQGGKEGGREGGGRREGREEERRERGRRLIENAIAKKSNAYTCTQYIAVFFEHKYLRDSITLHIQMYDHTKHA